MFRGAGVVPARANGTSISAFNAPDSLDMIMMVSSSFVAAIRFILFSPLM
jgi:hypothetical protein